MESAVSVKQLLDECRQLFGTNSHAAFAVCERAILHAVHTGNLSEEADARHLMAQIVFGQGQHELAVAEIEKAIEIRSALNLVGKLASSYNSYGVFLDAMSRHGAALEAYFKSLKIKEELNDKKGIASTLVNIGSVYSRLHNTERELQMYERAREIAHELQDDRTLAYINLNLGILYWRKEEYENALQHLEGIEEKLQAAGDSLNAQKAVMNRGLIYLKLQRFDKAENNFNTVLQLSHQTNDHTLAAVAHTNMAELGLHKNDLKSAIAHAQLAIQIATINNLKECVKDATLLLSEIEQRAGNHQNALEEYKKHIAAKDNLMSLHNIKLLEELHLKYDLERKQQEAEIHQLKNVELKAALDKLQEEKQRSDNLLRNILPDEVADELKQSGKAKAKYFEAVTVMFIDIRNFTLISETLTPEELVSEIDFLFKKFDAIIQQYDLEKIKTIGDAYMCVAGLPVPDALHATKAANAALAIAALMNDLQTERVKNNQPFFEVRIGLHSGPVVAGIVGSLKFAYDIWGDTVNTAARMEEHGEAGKINVSGETYRLLKTPYNFTYRGKVHAKNKGDIDMYFLNHANT